MAENELKSILESVAYMCVKSIEKSHQLITKCNRNVIATEQVKNENINDTKNLIDRMITNLVEFQNRIEKLFDKSQLNAENTTQNGCNDVYVKLERLSRLSLIKTRPDSLEDFDIDLNGSIVTTIKNNLTLNNTNIKEDKKNEDECSDADTIILTDDDDNNDSSDNEKQIYEEELEKIKIKTEQRADKFHKENSELWKILMEIPMDQDRDVENAFQSMDELDENSSNDSNDTTSYDTSSDSPTIIMSESSSSNNSKDIDDQNSGTPTPSSLSLLSDDEKSIAVKKMDNLILKLKRLDQMNDDEVDRLCNLNEIKKRNCRKAIKQIKKIKNRKRRRIESLSSSSSTTTTTIDSDNDNDRGRNFHQDSLDSNDDNDEDDDDLTVSDIDEDCHKYDKNVNDKELLAELFLNENLSDSMEVSDDSSDDRSDIDGIKEGKKRSCKTTDNQEKNKRKRYSPLRFVVDDSSCFSSSSDNGVQTKNKENDNENKELTNVTVIDDSDSSSSIEFLDDDDNSDLEFISQVQIDPASIPGRKQIRRILSDEELTEATQQARLEESQRIQRLEELAKIKEPLCSQQDKLILDMNVKTKTPLITVDDRLYGKLKPHQIDGIKFMWEACYESVDAINNGKHGSGCILAHCMGLGKTYQAITLIHTVLTNKITKTKHVLVMCPLSTVLNWKNEFQLCFDLLGSMPNYQLYYIVKENPNERYDIIEKWQNTGGVLVMGYDVFVRLVCDNKTEETRRNQLKCSLTNPGPDLVICDEGHLLKNAKAKRSEALMSIKTSRKIVLTGTPLQNNLKEYYYMVKFVKPGILGTFSEYTNRFVNPIMNGQFHDSDISDIKLMKKRTHVLNKLLKKTIHRVESSILKQYLPTILDYTIFIKLQSLQIDFYRSYVDSIRPDMRERQFFNDYRILQYICLHPYIIQLINNKKNEKKRKERDTINVDDEEEVDNIPIDWWSDLKKDDLSTNINYGPKLQIIFSIIDECERIGDKVLIFSHSLIELDCIEHFLRICGTKYRSNWVRNVDYFRLDGTVSPLDRINLCNRFNSAINKTKVFLVSQKVGGLGLNLIAANRVILVSTNFNPGYDTQSVYRIYRFGQNKMCYVYRLVTMGTMEEKIYQRCVVKLSLAGTVIDKFHIARHVARHDFFNTMYNLDIENYNKNIIPNVPTDRMLAKLLQTIKSIFNYNEYQALLENRPEEELNDEEKKMAWEEYNNEENDPVNRIESQAYQNQNNTVASHKYLTRLVFSWDPAKNAEALQPNPTVQRFLPSRPNQMPLQQVDSYDHNYIRQNLNNIARSSMLNHNVQPPSVSGTSSGAVTTNNAPVASTSSNNNRPIFNRSKLNQNQFQNNVPQPGISRLQNNVTLVNNDGQSNNLLSFNSHRKPLSVSYPKPNEHGRDTNGFFVRDKNSANQNDFLLNRFYK